MQFPSLILTSAGQALYVKILAEGGQMEFTKAEIGAGVISETADPETFTELIEKKQEGEIVKIVAEDIKAKITTVFSNAELEQGYNLRELGIYAKNIGTGEIILYAYSNAGDNADYMPPTYDSATLIEQEITVIIQIANADSVIMLDTSAVYALKSDLDSHKTSSESHEDMRTAINDKIIKKADAHNTDPAAHVNFRNASKTGAGIIKIATKSEIDAGTNVNKAVTPAELKNIINGMSQFYAPDLIFFDEKASGVPGGKIDSGSFVTRDINTILVNKLNVEIIDNLIFNLAAGNYYAEITSYISRVRGGIQRLYNNTTSTSLLQNILSQFAYNGSWINFNKPLICQGIFTLYQTSKLSVQVKVKVSDKKASLGGANDGLGTPADLDYTEKYLIGKIWKI